jgi:predicted O-methyltransferase YrrM
MFHAIPEAVRRRMAELEAMDARDRRQGGSRAERLRQIPPETGRFIALLAAASPEGAWLEIGTSGGYSALWLALACRARGERLTTFEVLPAKAALARQTFAEAGVEDCVELVEGDGRQHLAARQAISFCFLDAEKDVYGECYELVVPRLVLGGLLVADNALSHRSDLQAVLDRAEADPRVDALVVPIGSGVLVCRAVAPTGTQRSKGAPG